MTTPLYFARARLRRTAPLDALRRILVPGDGNVRTLAAHHLVWALFADGPERRRDFLWREADPGVLYTLSERPPRDPHGLFELDAPKVFAPAIQPGQVLRFALRANATVARGGGKGVRGKPCDVVMDALHTLSREDRAARRREVIESAARKWLSSQGAKSGFSLVREAEAEEATGGARVLDYRTWRLERRGAAAARIGVLDLEGVLRVNHPPRFVEALARGFGRAKAFGCGLMLIRRH